jgi:hypothetical protein
MAFRLAAVVCVVWGAAATPYSYPSYYDVVRRLNALNEQYPSVVEVWNAQEEYGIASAGMCRTNGGSPTPCKQWFIRITDESTLQQHPERPEVFFSGNLHGNEQVRHDLPH